MSFENSSDPEIRRLESGAKVIVYSRGKARLHTYVAREDSFGDASHIVETENKLVVIDAQYTKRYAKEFREYAEMLGKPGSIIISHSHPDHYLGLRYFVDVELIYALPETRNAIEQRGEKMLEEAKKTLGDNAVDYLVKPNETLNIEKDEYTIDGLVWKYHKVKHAEAEVQLVIELPEIKTLIVQDLIYNGYHAWFQNKDVSGWLKAIDGLKQYDASLILVGHGNPTIPESYNSMKRYVDYVGQLMEWYSKNEKNPEIAKQKIKAKILHAYPPEKRRGNVIIDMWLNYMF